MSQTVLVIGCGNMGHAMLKGWLDAGAIAANHVFVAEPNKDLRERAGSLGVHTAADLLEFKDTPITLAMIAVKPQMLETVLPNCRALAERGTQFFTVAAGAPLSTYERHLGATTGILRTMPNTPAAVGAGMIATIGNDALTSEADALAHRLLEANGVVARLQDESLMDAVTAISGSGPAYLFHFIECLQSAALAVGLPENLAGTFARQTIFGAARLAEQASEDAAQLRKNVTSPNGTTAAALDVLMGGRTMENLVTEAVMAAKRRSEELGRG